MKTRTIITIIGAIVIVLSATALVAGAYQTGVIKRDTIVFSKNEMLLNMWNSYKKTNIEESSGRTIDPQQANISTSEGQSYALLRSVWMDDRDTFNKSLKWANDVLKRPDNLYSWRYGPIGGGKFGIQTDQGGQNTASDGDSDIALALVMAYSRWNDTSYLDQAKPIIDAIWKYQVVSVQGKPVLAANDLERLSTEPIVVNPSYFSPAAYRVFAKIDPTHDWNGLSDNSYKILDDVTSMNLGSSKSAGLPPDWIRINKTTGEYVAPGGNMTTNYGYDAMRVSWRLGLDYMWNKEPRAKSILEKFSLLDNSWERDGNISATYAHDGTVKDNYESASMYGTSMGYFTVVKPDQAKNIYEAKLKKLYNPDKQTAVDNLSYYDANWAWFGIAMEQNALPDLTK